MAEINFFSDGVPFVLRNKTAVRAWLSRCAKAEKKSIGAINYIFCSDSYLRKINRQYLSHDYNTDIITFPGAAKMGATLSGDIFISIDRIRDHARQYKVPVADELHRVMVHGILHLCGYRDKRPAEQKMMKKGEDYCLRIRPGSLAKSPR